LVQQGEYGPVVITKGIFKGCIALYDDDDTEHLCDASCDYEKSCEEGYECQNWVDSAIVYIYKDDGYNLIPYEYIESIPLDPDYCFKNTMGYSIMRSAERIKEKGE
jgi:hypothetical protein